jgi:hypothetical protein
MVNISDLNLQQLKKAVVVARSIIETELLPSVRELRGDPVGPLPNFPNGTASACLHSLEQLAGIHKKYTDQIAAHSIEYSNEDWQRVAAALKTLGISAADLSGEFD